MEISIRPWQKADEHKVIDLITTIQQKEFGVPVTIEQQPDLNIVDTIYQVNGGNFWVAFDGELVVGTIGLINYQPYHAALRKMFVRKEYRGREKAVSMQLLKTAFHWCRQEEVKYIYLGTVERLQASHRFYEKNGFTRIAKEELPEAFPRMEVDTVFYGLKLNN